MKIFVDAGETEIIAEGVRYLRIEGAFYFGIGLLFLLSAVPAFGVTGIWWSVPIGWILADTVGLLYFKANKEKLLSWKEV